MSPSGAIRTPYPGNFDDAKDIDLGDEFVIDIF
jgi:hypothetical protein